MIYNESQMFEPLNVILYLVDLLQRLRNVSFVKVSNSVSSSENQFCVVVFKHCLGFRVHFCLAT